MTNKPFPIEPFFRSLFKLATWAAWIAAGLILAEAILFALHPQPDTIEGWFQLLQGSPVIGLLDAWFLELPLYEAFLLVFLALYSLLKQDHAAWVLVGLALALLGSAVFFVTNNPFSLLSLGDILGWISLAGYISLIVFPMIVERRANKNMKHQSQG